MLITLLLSFVSQILSQETSTNGLCRYEQRFLASDGRALECDTVRVLERTAVEECIDIGCSLSAMAIAYHPGVRGCQLMLCDQLVFTDVADGNALSDIYAAVSIASPSEPTCPQYGLAVSRQSDLSVDCRYYQMELSPVDNLSYCQHVACLLNHTVYEYNGTHCRFYFCSAEELNRLATSDQYGAFDIYVKGLSTPTASNEPSAGLPTSTWSSTLPSSSLPTPTLSSTSTSTTPQNVATTRTVEESGSGDRAAVTPAIIGAVVGGMVCGVLLTVLAVVLIIKYRRKRDKNASEKVHSESKHDRHINASAPQTNGMITNPGYSSDVAFNSRATLEKELTQEETVYDTIEDTPPDVQSDDAAYSTLGDLGQESAPVYTGLSRPVGESQGHEYVGLYPDTPPAAANDGASDYASGSMYSYITSGEVPETLSRPYQNVESATAARNNSRVGPTDPGSKDHREKDRNKKDQTDY